MIQKMFTGLTRKFHALSFAMTTFLIEGRNTCDGLVFCFVFECWREYIPARPPHTNILAVDLLICRTTGLLTCKRCRARDESCPCCATDLSCTRSCLFLHEQKMHEQRTCQPTSPVVSTVDVVRNDGWTPIGCVLYIT
jgi:hypothetical protein